jgi:Mu transposase-like protein
VNRYVSGSPAVHRCRAPVPAGVATYQTRAHNLDNLKEGVLTPDIYDPALNPLYRDMLRHYGVVALPCRVRDPDRKGKVERGVGHTQRTPLQGQRFETIEAAQAYLDRWEDHWADTRIHGTTKRQVAVMFAEERPALGPLPLEPFRYYRFGDRTVHLDGCVEVEAAYYGAPPGWIGRRVHVQWNDAHVRLIEPTAGQLLREHFRSPRGHHRIDDRDRPARTPPTTLVLLGRAATAGAAIGAVCRQIYAQGTAHSVRQILGVLALAKKHGVAVVEEAATTALEIGVPTYRFLRKYIERRPSVPVTLRQIDPLIRQLSLYRDLVTQKTGGSE